MRDVKYPEVEVHLAGDDGNAYSVIGKVRKALKRAGVEKEEIDKFTDEATSGDYNNVLKTCMEWVVVL